MLYSDQLIASIQDVNDIMDIVGDYVSLKKKGANYWGNCPFHSEKTPSFSVNPAKRIFKCFGCGKGGSVFNFIMEIEGVNFPEAVKILADKAHIDLPTYEQKDTQTVSVEENLYEINRWAAKLFHDNLKGNSGKTGRDYFEKRKITPESIVRFGLGYSLDSWDDIKSHSYHDQLKTEYVEQVGLIIRKDDGGYYDRFRNRVMFPIQDAVGRVLGFTARILINDKEQAKYINSPESLIYHKGKVLYGLFQAKEEIRKKDEIILVEGNLDVVSLHQHDIKNVVATSGTALTTDQIKLIKRYTKKNFVFLYDGDNAGLKAMERSIELLFEEGLFPQIVTLPDGHDPDSYVQTFGTEEFLKFLRDKRRSFLEFINDYESGKIEHHDISSKKEIADKLITLIAKFNDQVGRDFLVKEVAKFTSLPESTIVSELRKKLSGEKKQSDRLVIQKPEIKDKPPQVQIVNDRMLSVAEHDLLKVISDYGKVMVEYLSFFIEPDHFSNSIAKRLYIRFILHFNEFEEWELSSFLEKCEEDERDLLIRVSMDKYSISPKWKDLGFDKSMLNHEKWVQDAIVDIRTNCINFKVADIQAKLKLSMETDEIISLMTEQKNLQKERDQLQSRKLFEFDQA